MVRNGVDEGIPGNVYLSGDETTGKAVLRDAINATVGFERLAADLEKPGKSLQHMLGLHGNPNTANFFAILRVLPEASRSEADRPSANRH
jgi:hypothetical protein